MVGPINDGTVQKTVDKSNASSYVGSEKTTTHEVVAWKTISFRNIWLMTSVHVRVPVAFPDLWLHRAVSKKERSQVPVVSEKVGANLASTFMPFFCRGPVSAENFVSCCCFFNTFYCQRCRKARFPVLQKASAPGKTCRRMRHSCVTNNMTTVMVRDGQEHTSPHPVTKPSRFVLKNLA